MGGGCVEVGGEGTVGVVCTEGVEEHAGKVAGVAAHAGGVTGVAVRGGVAVREGVAMWEGIAAREEVTVWEGIAAREGVTVREGVAERVGVAMREVTVRAGVVVCVVPERTGVSISGSGAKGGAGPRCGFSL